MTALAGHPFGGPPRTRGRWAARGGLILAVTFLPLLFPCGARADHVVQPPSTGAFTTSHGGCVLYATTESFGGYCVAGSKTVSLREILGADPWVPCRAELDDSVPAEPGGARWYIVRCIRTIDPVTLQPSEPLTMTEQWQLVPPGEHIWVLTENQQRAWQFESGRYPDPRLGFTPTRWPRVGIETRLVAGAPGPIDGPRLWDGSAEVRVSARVVGLHGDWGDEAETAQAGAVAEASRFACDLAGRDSFCAHVYQRSSAHLDDPAGPHTYPVHVFVRWLVTYTAGNRDTPHVVGTVDRPVLLRATVEEIQTLNQSEAPGH